MKYWRLRYIDAIEAATRFDVVRLNAIIDEVADRRVHLWELPTFVFYRGVDKGRFSAISTSIPAGWPHGAPYPVLNHRG